MSDQEIIVGIDLGTTNSEIAAFVDNKVAVLGSEDTKMLPSCVGLSPSGQLLVGQSAANQLMLYPELTVHSIKRKMGTDEKVSLGEQTFTPEEISAIIIRELAELAAGQLGKPVKKAVITVPAYFSDTQRQATRYAGQLAGLEVVRVLNEPTAASLAYGLQEKSRQTVMVYDLGGGTFDVSIVSIEADVTEVLASHGNNHLGGDDFDQLILEKLLQQFQQKHGMDLKDCHPASYARLCRAAEKAKRKLSFEPYARIREESLAVVNDKPLHLDVELSREEYESMIRPLVETTLESVSRVIEDAGQDVSDIDTILLAGGSTRTPLLRQMLEERTGVCVREDIHPDLCVALGAGLQASRLAGHQVERVLVDVCPYSFGPSYLGDKDGYPYPYCYRPIIKRNTPLPVSRTEKYFTAVPYQESVEVEIFQGDDPDALKNIPVGKFRITGLTPTKDHNEVLCKMNLNPEGILQVAAIEKRTGKSKYISVNNALKPRDDKEIAAARKRLKNLYAKRGEDFMETFNSGVDSDYSIQDAEVVDTQFVDTNEDQCHKDFTEAMQLINRSRTLLDHIHEEDKEEMIELHERIHEAIEAANTEQVSKGVEDLKELLFFIEGKS